MNNARDVVKWKHEVLSEALLCCVSSMRNVVSRKWNIGYIPFDPHILPSILEKCMQNEHTLVVNGTRIGAKE